MTGLVLNPGGAEEDRRRKRCQVSSDFEVEKEGRTVLLDLSKLNGEGDEVRSLCRVWKGFGSSDHLVGLVLPEETERGEKVNVLKMD